MRKLEKAAFETKTKEIKILATIESTNFIHKWSIKIMSAVSKEFRTLLSQFIDFRRVTWTVIDNLKDYGERMKKSECVAAMQYPIYDFRYRADPESPFRLYNCLKPELKSKAHIPKGYHEESYITDALLKLRINEDKYAFRRIQINRLEK